ncbi:unnamed protein product [Ixodes hexagonus]
MAGLRCVQPSIRAKFFEVFEGSQRRRLHDRLLYIVCSQNWETIGPHFWIKQCLELVLSTAVSNAPLRSAQPGALLPAATAGLLQADALDRDTLALATPLKEEPPDTEVWGADILCPESDNRTCICVFLSLLQEEIEIELGEEAPVRGVLENTFRAGSDPRQQLQQLVQRQARFLESLREVRTGGFLAATAQLCHLDTGLAQHLWVELLPRLWKVLSDKQQSVSGPSVS